MDNESDAVMMLMDLGAYEKMLDRSPGVEKLTEEELLEKINRDVAVWRAYNDKQSAEVYDEGLEKSVGVRSSVAEMNDQAVRANSVAEPISVEKGRRVNLDTESDTAVTLSKYPSIQAEQEQSAQDIISDEEEEKFYLEPIE